MSSGRALQPDQRLSQFRIVGPLGAGGMGEVYLAQDQTLERNVALKILPPELVRSEDRVRRFIQEAKSASSLNHPNIVTIYEIGQDHVRSAAGDIEADSASVQFISMELVSGKTLAAKIHDERTDLQSLLGYLAQAAEGIAKAHAAGIVHRDLKPGNIMVSDDGFAKVLDFGLAKLLEKRGTDPDQTSAPTEAPEQTSAGTVLGTVQYMSPEQVQGKVIDHRSDIFSFGCILYEAATRQRPFAADSNVEIMHKILHDKPPPIEDIVASVPAELRRLIRRCMAKAPDHRLQSMKDLAIELREIVDEYETLSASASSASGSTATLPVSGGRRVPLVPILAGAAVVTIAGLGIGLWGMQRSKRERTAQPFQTVRMTTQTNRGDVSECSLSPDGRYLAYITQAFGRWGLRVRQVATGSDVEVLPSQEQELWFPTFSPDGNYVFFVKRKPETPIYRALYRVPSLGGSPQERAFDVDSRPTFSPDGKRICFMRGAPQESRSWLIVKDLDTKEERRLVEIRDPLSFGGAPDWSPDGKHIIALVQSAPPKLSTTLAVYDAETGRRQDLATRPQTRGWDPAWLRDGSAVAFAGFDFTSGFSGQISLVSYPDGELRRVTNDFNTYWTLSASAGDPTLAAVRQSFLSNLWTVDAAAATARQITSITSPENSPFGSVETNDELVIYRATHDSGLGLWSLPSGGGEAKPLETGTGLVTGLSYAAGAVLFNRLDPDGSQHIWAMAPDGSNTRQLTRGAGERILSESEAGRFITFIRPDSSRHIWTIPIDGGEEHLLTAAAFSEVALPSPDGQRILTSELTDAGAGLLAEVYRVHPIGGGPAVATIRLPAGASGQEWSGDGGSLLYTDTADSTNNVFRQPIDGSTHARVTQFTSGRTIAFGHSPDGSRLAVVRRVGRQCGLWLTAADGSHPVEVPGFAANQFFGLHWTPDGRHLVLAGGSSSQDAVLLKNFK